MKIVELISQMDRRGGAEVFFASLSIALAKQNDVYCVVLHDGIDPSFDELKRKFGSRLIFLGKDKRIDFKSNLRLKKLIRKLSPDVIHSHSQCAVSMFLAFGCKKQSFKYFHTVHSIASKEGPFYDRIAKKIMISAKRLQLVAISNGVEETIERIYGAQCPIVENGINFTRYSSIQPKTTFCGRFICVAGFRPVKNHELLLKAFSKLSKEGFTFHLTCCGGGETLPNSMRLAQELGIAHVVTFTGQVSDVLPYLKKNDCLVSSSHYEGSPISLIEALAAGLPCIAPNVGGIPDLLDSNDGLLYEAESVDSLVASLRFFFKQPDSFQSFSLAAKKASQQFDIKRCADEYLKLFLEAIK